MGITNRAGALYMATGIDNTGLYKGKGEAMGLIKAMAGEITSFDIFGGIGVSAAVAFAKAAKDAYTFEKDFQKSMYEVASISGTIKGSLTDYMNSLVEMTRQIPVAANDSAKALYQIVSAGHDGADAMKILEVSAKAAVGGVTDTATAADAITTVLNAYKMSASEAGKVSDMLFTTAKLGKTTMGELGQTIAQAAPIAASYGVGIDQVLAAVASLTKQGTPTAQAMTQIRASILGVSKVLGDGAFDGRTYQEALAEVAKRANGSESELRKLVPEIEAVNAVLGMTGNNANAAASDLGQLQNSLGASEAAFKTMQESADNQLQLLQNNITATLRPLGEGILKEVAGVAQKMNDAFSNGDMENSLQTMETLIKLVSVAFVAYKVNANGAAIATTVQATATTLLNNVKATYNTVSGAGLIAKEKERVSQLAYIASLEKTLNAEQRATISKINLKAGTKEYATAVTGLKEKEKEAADKQVTAFGKETSAAEKSMVTAKQQAATSSALVSTRKQELAALTSAVQAEKMATAQKELASATDKQRAARGNAIALNRQKIAAQQAIINAKESGQSAAKVAVLEREIHAINKKVVAAKAEYASATRTVVAKQTEIASINRGVVSKEIDTATQRLNTAVEKENTASTAANAAMKDFYAKKSATAIASTKAGTIATALNSAQQRGNAASAALSTSAHGFLAAAKMKAIIATRTLTVAMLANPWSALLTAATLAASAMMMFGSSTDNASTVQERFNKSLEEQKKQLT